MSNFSEFFIQNSSDELTNVTQVIPSNNDNEMQTNIMTLLQSVVEQNKELKEEITNFKEENKKVNVRILNEITAIRKQYPNNSNVGVIPKKPLSSILEFKNFEQSIENTMEMHEILETEIRNIQISDHKKFVRTVWAKIICDEVAVDCSWSGANNKFAVNLLNITAIIRSNNEDNLKENMNIPVNVSVDSNDSNPLSTDDELPLTKYVKTSFSPTHSKEDEILSINSKGETVNPDGDTTDDEISWSEFSTSTSISCKNLKKHKSESSTKHIEQNYPCPHCPKKFAVKKSVNRHVRNIHCVYYQCLHCPTKCNLKQSIQEHIQNVHPDELTANSDNESNHFKIISPKETEREIPHNRCSLCLETFKEKTDLRQHFENVHPEKQENECGTTHLEQKYHCPHCPKEFALKNSVNRHVRNNHPDKLVRYQCLYCPIKCKLKSSIRRHIRKVHPNELTTMNSNNESNHSKICPPIKTECKIPVYRCSHCLETFKERTDFRDHLENVHPEKTKSESSTAQIEPPKYTCPYCPKMFALKNSVNRHVRKNHSEENTRSDFRHHLENVHPEKTESESSTAQIEPKYTCPYCPKMFRLKTSVNRHVRKNHSEENTKTSVNHQVRKNHSEENTCYQCLYCPKTCKLRHSIRVHIRNWHPNELTENSTNKSEHFKKVTLSETLQYSCDHCTETFKEKTHLQHHFENVHPNEFALSCDYDGFIAKWKKELECHVCKYKFANFSLLTKHFEVEHPENRCYIPCCGRKLSYRLALVEHIRLHLDPNFFACKICGKRAINKRFLKIHMRTHTQDPRYQCKVCKRYCLNNEKLRLHAGTHITEKKYKCTVCKKFFSTELLRKKHETNYHKGKPLCDQCGKSFYNLKNLQLHQLQHHDIQDSSNNEAAIVLAPKIPCELCGLQFKTHLTLKVHKNSFHNDGSKVYECSDCGKIYGCEIALNSHKKVVHTTQRFKCNFCDKEFKYSSQFRTHVASHQRSPIDLVQCPHCPSTLKHKSNMRRHLRNIHPTEFAKMEQFTRPKIDLSSAKEKIVI